MIPPRDMTEKQYAKAQMTSISANETVLFTFPRKIFLMRIKYAKAPFKSSNREKKMVRGKLSEAASGGVLSKMVLLKIPQIS